MNEENLELNIVNTSFEITQDMSKKFKGHNFRCPCCHLHRIAKANINGKNDWNHTGCRCTYRWLSAHGKLIYAMPEKFPCTNRFKG